MPAVTVNLNVEVNADGEIKVFGAPAPTLTNEVVATCKLPVTALYDSDANGTLGAGLIEFWEPSNDLGNIYAQLAGYAADSQFKVNGVATYKTTAKELAKGLQKVLVSQLDATAASPFNNAKYDGANDDDYRKCSDFGRLALSVYSHYIFGHVDATAAITNDEDVMANMLSLSSTDNVKEGGSASGRYNHWKHLTTIVNATDVDGWDVTGSSSDAKLAIALAKEVVKKGLGGKISATRAFSTEAETANNLKPAAERVQASTENGTLAEIVRQVLGQDANRAMDQDNNALAPEVHQILKFAEGDTIYVSIKVKKPSVIFSGAGQYLTEQAAQDKVTTEEVYNVKITLGDADF